MHRRLFCELSPLAYRISIKKSCALRTLQDYTSGEHFAKKRAEAPLPALIYRHNSLIRRTLGEVDPVLQENKAVNLALAAPKINGILIRPGETFSFCISSGRRSPRAATARGWSSPTHRPARPSAAECANSATSSTGWCSTRR